MKLVIISGRSGSGKSTALQALEDVGFYCIDNLPAKLLPELISHITDDDAQLKRVAVCIDARNLSSNLEKLPDIWHQVKRNNEISVEMVYLDASHETLLRRYSSTRRRHPLADRVDNLSDAINFEHNLLSPIADLADIRVDTTRLSLYELRDTVKLRVAQRKDQALSLQFESFGFKHGVPMDVDVVYDMRILPNPYWVPELRQHTGRDKPVQLFLQDSDDVNAMIDDIKAYLEKWLPSFTQNNRSYVTIGIGCTGGQHRSVYVAEQLYSHFSGIMDNVSIRHRELN
ncbi:MULTISPECIES: RNase adapter RapZ [Neptunomonas]|uniref:RNase adapter RapZ n=1 Tax=Neptunomonas marina TaxID=1815562 RepID=A0A437Q869_9GAMM|nr:MULTISPECIES: RNase adapter RapZ [Neptunomonas]RVU30676.1 RNase adapter RapZ [Neptunomonas marina]